MLLSFCMNKMLFEVEQALSLGKLFEDLGNCSSGISSSFLDDMDSIYVYFWEL